jgi:sigma-70-like protein
MLRDCGYTYVEIGRMLGLSSGRARAIWANARARVEAAPGYLDSPAEFYDYERWGDRPRSRRPGFGHAVTTRYL